MKQSKKAAARLKKRQERFERITKPMTSAGAPPGFYRPGYKRPGSLSK